MKVLVTAASRHGSTAEIADLISGRLTDAGLSVTTLTPDQVDEVTSYDAVIIGSAVYMGHWMDTARNFVERFGPSLAGRPVWLFSSGPVGDPPKPDAEPADLPAMRAATNARGERVFAGQIDRSQLGLGEKLVLRAVHASDGDFRPLSDITQWADEIARSLRQPVLSST
jgi:menaquinone-dependent protoporphyrinogen oxidase